ncbi:hypothetical protein CU007_2481 [Enterococcus faecium]|nr:hypothetical protein [Enterococcus faecium]
MIARTRQLQVTVQIHLPLQVIARTRQLQVTVQIHLPQAIHVMQVSPSQKQVRITGRTLT